MSDMLYQLEEDQNTDDLLVNVGPQHPATHGVLRVLMRLDGEIVKQATPHIGYLHRCAEKICENLDYYQFIPYTDRMDYLGAFSNNMGFCMAVEEMLPDVQVPKRAQYLRIIFAELTRIASHLIAVGTYGLDIGAFTPFFYCWREREQVLDIFEKLCGARLTVSYARIGGVVYDMTPEIEQDIREFCKGFRQRVDEYNQLLTFNRIFIDRTRDVGVTPTELAVSYGFTGPNLRACGVDYDIRKHYPYSSYEEFDFKTCLGTTGHGGPLGDCWNRYYVRVQEFIESVKIIEQALDKLKSTAPGEIRPPKLKSIVRPEPNEVYSRSESPRGELGFYMVSDGGSKPYRCKIRGPSFCSLSATEEFSRGQMMADVIAYIGSIDIVLGDVDR